LQEILSMGVTQKDIAEYLGIDPSAVSYALKGSGTGSAASRKLVCDAAETLGYRPNILARSIRTGKSGTIAVLTGSDFQKIAKQLRHTESAAKAQGYHVLFSHGVSVVLSAQPEEIIKTELEQLERFMQLQVDGLFVQTATVYLSEALQKEYWDAVTALMPKAFPVVTFESPGQHVFPSIFMDHFKWGEYASEILAQLGYRSLAYVGSSTSLLSGQMYRGLQSNAHVQCAILNVDVIEAKSVHEGYRIAKSFKKGEAELLVAANALIAYGLLIGLREEGVRVPQDVSLIALGKGDVLAWPPHDISSIQYDHETVGKHAWQVMHGLLDGNTTIPPMDVKFHMGNGNTLIRNKQ